MYHNILFVLSAPTALTAIIEVGSIAATIKVIIDYVRAWMPDALEGQWIMPIAIACGIGLCYLAGLKGQEMIAQGIMYGLGASGIASGTNSAAKSAEAAKVAKAEKDTGKPEGTD
jgi:hypothetical protein